VTEHAAETMRRAAALMRERAGGCEPRRWHWEALGEKRYPQRVSSDGNVALIAETFIDPAHRPYEAEHIASWHPLVALAVAEWLETEAQLHGIRGHNSGEGHTFQALKVARAYLGDGGAA
jgi:hypothetical protein